MLFLHWTNKYKPFYLVLQSFYLSLKLLSCAVQPENNDKQTCVIQTS